MDSHNDYEKVEEKEDGERQLCCRFERQQCLEFAMLMTLLIAQFAGMCVDMLPLPFLTLEGKERGLKEIQVGIIFGSYDLARGIISPFIGTLSKKLLPKRTVILAGVTCGVSCIAFGIVGLSSGQMFFWFCLLLRIISGFAAAILKVTATSILMKCTRYKPSTLFGWIETSMGLGQMCGAAFGGGLYNVVGYKLTFVIFGGIMLLVMSPAVCVVPDIRAEEKSEYKTLGSFSLLKIPGIGAMRICCFMVECAWFGSFSMLSEWLFGLPMTTVTLLYTLWPMAYVITNPIASFTTNKGYVQSAGVTAWIIMTVALFMACPTPLMEPLLHQNHFLWLTILCFCTYTAASSWVFVTTFQGSLDLAVKGGFDGKSLQTFAMLSGLNNCASSLGAMAGPPISGAITQLYGFSWSVTVHASIFAFMILSYAVYLLVTKLIRTITKQDILSEKLPLMQEVEKPG